jgi:N-acetylmuramoyl-L-alanine amidase
MKKKRFLYHVMILTMALLLVAGGAAQASVLGSRTLRQGVRGDDVVQLQVFLNSHNFPAGPADGIFGPLTYNGLVRFQRAHNLLVDGIAGPQTFAAIKGLQNQPSIQAVAAPVQPIASRSNEGEFRFSPAEMDLFARLVHAEAEGEPYEGQVAAAASILNRIRSSLYPNTLNGVVYQISGGYYQYSPVLDGRIHRPAGDVAKRAVQDALTGRDPSKGATGFYNPRKTTNLWVRSRPVTAILGQHVFFK